MAEKHQNKIRVVHYCNQLSIGGTERTLEIFCKHLDKSKFDVHCISKLHAPDFLTRFKVEIGALFRNRAALGKKAVWRSMNARVPNITRDLGENHVHMVRSNAELAATLKHLRPDILHVHYSGNPEPPTSEEEILQSIPATVTTNQFERENNSTAHKKFVKKIFFPTRWLFDNKANWAHGDERAEVFPNPIEKPFSSENLRKQFSIPNDAFVVGRVGRAENGIYDQIGLEAYAEIETEKTWFLALSPPPVMLQHAKKLGLKNFIAVPPTTDQVFLSKFYNTIDVLGHARRDGETFGCNIAEAMMHGKPVVSHLSEFMNAQTEIVGETGFVVGLGDTKTYAKHLQKFRDEKDFRQEKATAAEKRALENFESVVLTRRLEKTYETLANN